MPSLIFKLMAHVDKQNIYVHFSDINVSIDLWSQLKIDTVLDTGD